MATPEQILRVKQLFDQQWPAPKGSAWIPDSQVGPWIDAGNTPEHIAESLSHGMSVLGFTVDPPGGPSAGQWMGARYKALTGHFTLQDSIAPHFLEKKPVPADSYIRSRTISGLPSVNYDGTPATPTQPKPVEPPVVIPPVTQPGFLEAIIAKNAEQDGRIATLEAEVKGLREKAGATDGTPGGGD
jgi:hypothetical protein